MRDDIMQQPAALRAAIDYYASGEGAARLAAAPIERAPILTGMGGSYHAALATAAHFHSLGVPALAVEATELVFYSQVLLQERRPLVYISQSGASAEVAAIGESLPAGTALLAVTNNLDSPLAQHADLALPILAGTESGVATKTYVNSLAVLWLLARRWGGAQAGGGPILDQVAAEYERLLASADAIAERWLDVLGSAERLVYVGHGPHMATARQAAMMLAERARVAAIGTGVGAFRHGPIEIAQPGLSVAIFAPYGRSRVSALGIAADLASYGARVLVVEHGRARTPDEPASAENPGIDEFLAPMIDVIPAQLFADAVARKLGVGPGFRHIGKVTTQL